MNDETAVALRHEQTTTEPILSVIERAARDPLVDVAKMERLLELAEKVHARQAESAFDLAMNICQSEMRPVAHDSSNPQTRSRYASYGALDQAVRPIYSAHGFALSFGTRTNSADRITVTCRVSHRAGFSRNVEIDMPSDGKGAKGGDVMTKTHATGSAVSYGMRYLLKMIFNIALGEFDDDGNAASRRPPAKSAEPKQANGDKPLKERINALATWVISQLGPVDAEWLVPYLRVHTPDGGDKSAALMPNEKLEALSETVLAAIKADPKGFLERVKKFAQENDQVPGAEVKPRPAGPMMEKKIEVPRDPDAGEVGDWWKDVEIHFGKNKGTKLHELETKILFGWWANWIAGPAEPDQRLRRAFEAAGIHYNFEKKD